MLKKIGFSAMLLAGLLVFAAPRRADAEVRFGVTVGPAPVYTYPAYPADPYAYDPYSNYYSYPAPVYTYPAPTYVAPYSYGYYGRSWRDHDRHEWREHERHERHEFREHRGRRH